MGSRRTFQTWLVVNMRRGNHTVEGLANRLLVAPRTVQRWRTGAAFPRASQLAALFAVYGLPGTKLRCGSPARSRTFERARGFVTAHVDAAE